MWCDGRRGERVFILYPASTVCSLMLIMCCLAYKVATEQCIYHVSIKFVVVDSDWTGIRSIDCSISGVCMSAPFSWHLTITQYVLAISYKRLIRPWIPHCFPPPSCCCRDCCCCAS